MNVPIVPPPPPPLSCYIVLYPPVKKPHEVHACPCGPLEIINGSNIATTQGGHIDNIEGQSPSVSVQGHLKENATFWSEELEASNFVLGIVNEGYCLPFFTTPDPI